MIGCIWAMVATLTYGDYETNWMIEANLIDATNIDKYLASVYWAAVTIYTVGYGDITPQNTVEFVTCIIILFVGVSLYTYIFSKLSTLFSSVNASESPTKVNTFSLILQPIL
jgi:potassium voltage-gated channel Eag-related subfamily H protein 5